MYSVGLYFSLKNKQLRINPIKIDKTYWYQNDEKFISCLFWISQKMLCESAFWPFSAKKNKVFKDSQDSWSFRLPGYQNSGFTDFQHSGIPTILNFSLNKPELKMKLVNLPKLRSSDLTRFLLLWTNRRLLEAIPPWGKNWMRQVCLPARHKQPWCHFVCSSTIVVKMRSGTFRYFAHCGILLLIVVILQSLLSLRVFYVKYFQIELSNRFESSAKQQKWKWISALKYLHLTFTCSPCRVSSAVPSTN